MSGAHVAGSLSAALDGELTPDERQRFDEHLAGCPACASAFRELSGAVGLLRALPKEAMPRRVPIPATEPVIEHARRRFRIPSRWLPRRYLPGMATGVALVTAAVIFIIASHGMQPSNRASQSAGNGVPAAAPGGCPSIVAGAPVADVPAADHHVVSASDPSRPGQQLVIATASGDVTAGSTVQIFAQLTVIRPTVAAPGATGSPLREAALPCLSVSASGSRATAALSTAAAPAVPLNGIQVAPQLIPQSTLTIPPGTPHGTELHVVASVPPGYLGAAGAPLTADLVLTVR